MNKVRPPSLSTFAFFWLVFACTGLTAPEPKPTLLDLAKEHFAPRQLTEAEEKLFTAVEKGELASMLSKNEQENNPSVASTWPATRSLHAEALVWLCTDAAASARINYRGVRFQGMCVEGELDLSEAKLKCMFAATKCAFDNDIRLSGAQLRWFVLNGSVINSLTARRTQFDADVSLSEGFVAKGPVYLASSTISGDLFCVNAQLEKLSVEQATIKGGVILTQSHFKEVNLLAATIGESLDCDGAHLANPGAIALTAERATIQGNVSLGIGNRATTPPTPPERVPFQAEGQVNLVGTIIHGNLECRGAHLTHPPADSALLLADHARISGRIFLGRGFCCDGLAAIRASEASYLMWIGVETTNNTVIDLQSAKFGAVWSDNLAWVRPGNLVLDGFIYSRLLAGADAGRKELLNWLALQSPKRFYPQPYEQLSAVLKATGREKEARDIMVAKNRQHRQFTQAPWGDWWWYNVFGRVIGYGYLPSRAFFMSLGLIFLGAVLFRSGYSNAIITPTKEGQRPIAESYPRFNAFVYSLESFTPLLKLDQSSNWAPNANRGTQVHFGRVKLLTTGRWLRIYLWFHIIAGWVLTSLWVGSITGLVKT